MSLPIKDLERRMISEQNAILPPCPAFTGQGGQLERLGSTRGGPAKLSRVWVGSFPKEWPENREVTLLRGTGLRTKVQSESDSEAAYQEGEAILG